MHRASFHDFMANGRMRNAYRGQGRVLSILKMKPEISQKELTYLLGVSKQSLAELLAKLEKSGYITRTPSDEDKRAVTVKLTDKGKTASPPDKDSDATDTETIPDCLNDAELVTFSEYLGRIIKRYEEQFPDEDYDERRKYVEEFMSLHGHGHGFGAFGGRGGRPHNRGAHPEHHSFFCGFNRGGCHGDQPRGHDCEHRRPNPCL
ncbi:MAG: MarR family transcriptional regulator [Prevotellaceae bacterium]|nr:MarR family transcriptional regulator [Prevotellaceae bacterium]